MLGSMSRLPEQAHRNIFKDQCTCRHSTQWLGGAARRAVKSSCEVPRAHQGDLHFNDIRYNPGLFRQEI